VLVLSLFGLFSACATYTPEQEQAAQNLQQIGNDAQRQHQQSTAAPKNCQVVDMGGGVYQQTCN
jgi:hypothetical protein